jgi:putative toxin-antitoxin system antitoxin component (TIGR02293 family)
MTPRAHARQDLAEPTHPGYDLPRDPEELLGGADVLARVPCSPLDWVAMIRHGLPAASVDALARGTGLTRAEVAAAIAVPERTLARRKQEGRLHAEESSRLVRLARVIARAEAVFEGPAAAMDWLESANTALEGATPLSLLDTDIGAEGVMDTLGRIEHGVFA